MKRFKSIAALALACTVAAAPANVMAAETAKENISVQINGEDLSFTDAEPVIVNSRVFVPFRAVFEGLSAEEIAYTAETKTVSAKKGSTSVEFTIGEKTISVTKDGIEEKIETDAASFIKDDRTYIPVRFAASALECQVGWDSENKTAIIVENNIFAPGEGITYELMNKYLEYQNKISQDKHSISGKLNLAMSMQNGSESFDITGDITLSGLIDQSNINLNMASKLDLSKLEELLKSQETTVGENEQKALDAIKNLEVDYIFNLETGKMYVKCDALSGLTGMTTENTWYLVDFNKLFEMSGMNINLKELMKLSKTNDFESQLKSLYTMVPLNNKYSAAAVIESLKMVEGLYSDAALEKVGDEYVSTYTLEQEGSSSKIDFALAMKGEDVSGYSMKMTTSFLGSELMTMDIVQKGLESTVSMKMGMEPFFSISANGDIKYSPTVNKPVTSPDSKANIVDVMNILSNVMVTETVTENTAEVTTVTDVEDVAETPETTETAEDSAA